MKQHLTPNTRGFTLLDIMVIVFVISSILAITTSLLTPPAKRIPFSKIVTVQKSFTVERRLYVGTDKGVFEVIAEEHNYPKTLEIFSKLITDKTYDVQGAYQNGQPKIYSANEIKSEPTTPEKP